MKGEVLTVMGLVQANTLPNESCQIFKGYVHLTDSSGKQYCVVGSGLIESDKIVQSKQYYRGSNPYSIVARLPIEKVAELARFRTELELNTTLDTLLSA